MSTRDGVIRRDAKILIEQEVRGGIPLRTCHEQALRLDVCRNDYGREPPWAKAGPDVGPVLPSHK